jgi:hypothetical protein
VNLVTGAGHRTTQSAIRRILCDAFADVRTVRSPEAMNEVLVAGQAVATTRRLRKWDTAFAEAGDRAYWRKVAVRRIS